MTFLLSEKVTASGMVGIFENSFYLTNYESSNKRPMSEEEKVDALKGDDDDKDDRKVRINKKIDSYAILCEKDDALKTVEADFWRVQAKSTEYARFLCNTRGSVADPDWMEMKIRELVKDHPSVKEVRVLQADKL